MRTFLIAVLVALLAGCAAPAASPTPPPSSAPTHSSGPPDMPTDRLKPPGYVVGTVTAGGPGPCYTLTTDDGTRYALHSADGITMVKGARMRVTIKPAVAKIWCGPGKLVEMTAAAPLR
jgi:hypothetical protein